MPCLGYTQWCGTFPNVNPKTARHVYVTQALLNLAAKQPNNAHSPDQAPDRNSLDTAKPAARGRLGRARRRARRLLGAAGDGDVEAVVVGARDRRRRRRAGGRLVHGAADRCGAHGRRGALQAARLLQRGRDGVPERAGRDGAREGVGRRALGECRDLDGSGGR